MPINAVTHLNFHGNARQALEFYHAAFGGNLAIATYADFGAPKDIPTADQVVWGQVSSENGFQVMAYDVPAQDQPQALAPSTHRENGMTITNAPFFISLRGESTDEVMALWEKLSSGATIIEPIAQSAWAQLFGMLTDQFGVTWVVDVVNQYNG